MCTESIWEEFNKPLKSFIKRRVRNDQDVDDILQNVSEFKNIPQKDLGERIGLSVSGAKSRVQRAREKFKKMLLDCCQFELDHMGNIIEYRHKTDKCKFC